MKLWQKWALSALGLLVATIIVFVAVFDWNWLRAPLIEQASNRTGRTIHVGDLHGQWSLVPTVTMRDVHVGNADWAKAPDLFSAELIEVSIDLRQMVRGRMVLPEIRLVKPIIALEVGPDGANNWTLGTKVAADMVTPDDRTDVPVVGRLDIVDGQLKYSDPGKGLNIDGKIRTVVGTGGRGEGRVQLTGNGTLQGQRFDIDFSGGSLLSLRENDAPYPLSIDLNALGSHARIAGTLDDPVTFDGLDLRAEMQGPDLSRLTSITGVPFPITPPYDLSARLQREGKVWTLTDLGGEMGRSDLHGEIKVDAGRPRLYIDADLNSKILDYRDVGFLIGVPPSENEPKTAKEDRAADARPDEVKKAEAEKKVAAAKEAAQQPHEPKRVLPDAPLSVKEVRATDARVKFRGERVNAPNAPLSGVQLDLEMKDGVLHMMPLQVGVAGGTAIADIKIDARSDTVKTDYDIKLRAFELNDFLKSAGFEKAGSGRIDGRIRLAGTGDTVRKSLGSSNGDVRLVVNHGQMSNLAIEIIGLDVAQTLGLWATDKDKTVEIRCMIADIGVKNGIMDPRIFVLDTTDSMIDVKGAADLRTELMNLEIAAHPKDTSVFAVRTPITVAGTFAEPNVGLDKGPLVARAAAAVALGVLLTPAASVLAFIDPGMERDSDCAALLRQVQAPADVKTPDKVEAPR